MTIKIFGNKDSNLKLQLVKFIHKFQGMNAFTLEVIAE